MDRWVGKIAMVTGASYGIGAAIAEFLVDCGLLVVGVARSKEKLDELAKRLTNKKGKLYSIKVDMMQEKEILEAFKWTTDNLGPISILINNAAVLIPKLLTECPTEDLTKMFDTNIKGLCISTREAIRIMRENKIDGHIIQLSSIAGRYVVSPETGIYSSTKHAVTALVESIRRELQLLNTKIKISSVSPGVVATDMSAGALGEEAKRIPALSVQDIADCVKYILETPPNVQVHEIIIKPIGEPF